MLPRWRRIIVPRVTKTQRVLEFVAARGWERVGEAEWAELRAGLPDVSEGVVRDSGLAIDAPWCGVRQHTFDELEESLREFSAVYAARADLRGLCRELVIAAKDRAKWLAGRDALGEETRRRKAEMVEWMLVWLGDPGVFGVWVGVVRGIMAQTESDRFEAGL